MRPNDVEQTYGITPFRVHHLGTTSTTQRDFEKYLISIQVNFTRECYDLVKWNCNNFTDHASRFLLHRGIPAYILDLPDSITNTFMGKMIINFIKMFSDAPAIDSESASHPKQTLALRFSNRMGRRTSCPGSPMEGISDPFVFRRVGGIADGSRHITRQEQSALRKLRLYNIERREGRALEKPSSRHRSSSVSSCLPDKIVQEHTRSRSLYMHSLARRSADVTHQAKLLNVDKPGMKRSSVPALIFTCPSSIQSPHSSIDTSSTSPSNPSTPSNTVLTVLRQFTLKPNRSLQMP